MLADGDTVSLSNLNRQFYIQSDIGTNKATALAKRILDINPEAEIEIIPEFLTETNIPGIVARADFIFDTVDFVDLVAIVALHDACEKMGKPRITALNIGFDGGLIYFPNDSTYSFRKVFWLPLSGSVGHIDYTQAYTDVVTKLAPHLNPEVIYAIGQALTIMEDGTPCPASQIAPGSFAVASLWGNILYRILANLPVSEAPYFLLSHHNQDLNSQKINLLEG